MERLSYSSSRPLQFTPKSFAGEDDDAGEYQESGYSRPVVQWYPGHIAKAERELSKTLKCVDVVVEVRDARAISATSHPLVGTWCAGIPRIVALTRGDAVPGKARSSWKSYFESYGAAQADETLNRLVANQAAQARQERFKYSPGGTALSAAAAVSSTSSTVESVLFVNGATGAGVPALKRAIVSSGVHVQERRRRRGLLPRPLRVALLGYPNTGKSSILNKLIGVKRAQTSNRPGVTRTLQWIRVKDADDLEMLDSPGVIPATLVDQSDATLLAACNCIGSAAYDNQAVAAYLCQWLLDMYRSQEGDLAAPHWRTACIKRYQLDPLHDAALTGEDILYLVAENTCQGNQEDAARKILQDFRKERLGPICLQLSPIQALDGHSARKSLSAVKKDVERIGRIQELQKEQVERSRRAAETAKELGLDLPPRISDPSPEGKQDVLQVGKGLFEGW